jgi:hypothetical protein
MFTRRLATAALIALAAGSAGAQSGTYGGSSAGAQSVGYGSAAGAQAAIYGAGLEAWTGCWSAEQSPTAAGVVPLVCITPTANVNVANVANIEGNVVVLETLDATGQPVTLAVPGCTGTRRTAWSRDSRRLFLSTSGVCRGVPIATSAMFTISTSGEWVRVEGSDVRGVTNVHVARYRDVGVPAGLPPDIAASVRKNALARESTRAAFAAPVHFDDVVEALELANADVVAAWIRERAQQFDVTQTDLANFDLTGFPPRVAEALTTIADSTAALARAADSASYAAYVMDQQAIDYYDDFVPLAYWGAAFPAMFASRRGGGVRGGPGPRGAPPVGNGGTVRLGRPRS